MRGPRLDVKVAGLGGIGGALVPFLARFLDAHEPPPPARLTLIDGDDFEARNRLRQGTSGRTTLPPSSMKETTSCWQWIIIPPGGWSAIIAAGSVTWW